MGYRLRAVLGIPGPDKSIYTGELITGIIDRAQYYLHYFLDTPAYSLSRMCNFLKAGDWIALTDEVQYFWSRGWPQKKMELKRWRVCNLPYPADEPDEERRIIMVCLAEQLADAFNELISRGLPRGAPMLDVEYPKGTSFELESPPAWCNLIMNPKGIHINIEYHSCLLDDVKFCSANFLKRGIRVDKHIMYFA